MKRIFAGIILVLLLTGMLALAFNVKPVRASGTLYIRADGSIDPPDDPISTLDNVTYTLTGDINDSIVVERDNIIFDGNGHVLQGDLSSYGTGLDLSERKNVTVMNIDSHGWWYVIRLVRSSNNKIVGNNLTWNEYSIYLSESLNNSIVGNNITEFFGFGVYLYKSSSNNSVVGNYFESWGGSSIGVSQSDNNSISGNHITTNEYRAGSGIALFYSSYNSVFNNNIWEYNTRYSSEDYFGVGLWYSSSHNIIAGNEITDGSGSGVYIYGSSMNTIFGNYIAGNTYGTGRMYSSGNILYGNDFVDNAQQEYDEVPELPSIDAWDNGYPSGGNYWSNYTGADLDYDGIGDTPHVIDGNNTDNYPLMGMFTDFNTTSEYHVQAICNSSISDFQSNSTSISFNVTGEDGTAGFCRICIPTALMNATYKVFVNSTEVPCNLLPCSNSTHSYLYFNYTHSTEQVIIVPEFPSILILPLFIMATLLAVIVHRNGGTKNKKTNSDDAT